MTAAQLSRKQFDDLVMRQMHGEATPEEEDYLSSPSVIYRWRHVLSRKRGQANRHISTRRATLEIMRMELKLDTDDDVDTLTDDEYDSYFEKKEEIESKITSTIKFIAYIDDSLEEVNELIREMGNAYDPAEVVMLVLEAREELLDAMHDCPDGTLAPTHKKLNEVIDLLALSGVRP